MTWIIGAWLRRPAALHAWPTRPLTHARVLALGVLTLAVVQGLLYLFLVPPWQHYDEPTHFEYAWLIANRGTLPQAGDFDQTMRRELAASMVEHQFYWNIAQPNLYSDTVPIDVGQSELGHPPTYYMLVSLPLRAARYLDITSQLYVARAVSLVLFVLTIAIAVGLMRELVPAHHALRTAVPLALALLPPFADIMTAVNNDAGAICIFTIFLWLGVRTIRYGVTWPRAIALLAVAAIGTATKNTAAVGLLLFLPALAVGGWIKRGWRWRWLFLGLAAALGGLAVTTLAWGDSATWYRQSLGSTQASPTRTAVAAAPFGTYALRLDSAATPIETSLLNPLLGADVARVAGEPVTAGAWVWASTPTTAATLNIDYSTAASPRSVLRAQPMTLGTTPQFFMVHADIPADAAHVDVRLALTPADAQPPITVYLDGAVLMPGHQPADSVPQFDADDAARGQWGGQRFTNALRNASAEQAWPRLRPWVDQLLITYIRRSPTLVVSALFDIQRTGPTLLVASPVKLVQLFFGSFGWGHVNLDPALWTPIWYGGIALALVGCILWLRKGPHDAANTTLPALAFLAAAGALVWGNVLSRGLPLLDGSNAFTVARYGFPAALPAILFLVGGWWALWPRRWRVPAVGALLVGMGVLDGAALWTIWSFYVSISI